MLSLDLASRKVNIRHGIKFCQHDVDIVGAHARRDNGNMLALIKAGMRDQFSILFFHFYSVEQTGYHGDTTRVADQQHIVRQLVSMQIEVINSSVVLFG